MDYYDMEDELSAADLKEFIKRMVGGLPPRQQEVFKMSRDEHLTYREIINFRPIQSIQSCKCLFISIF